MLARTIIEAVEIIKKDPALTCLSLFIVFVLFFIVLQELSGPHN